MVMILSWHIDLTVYIMFMLIRLLNNLINMTLCISLVALTLNPKREIERIFVLLRDLQKLLSLIFITRFRMNFGVNY